MAKTLWFTADWHLDHHKILEYCKRPFKTVQAMNETIINNINEVVKADDELYVLGDLAMGSSINLAKYLKEIKCKNLALIEGNHDWGVLKNPEVKSRFKFVTHYTDLAIGYQKLVLFHYPIASWNNRIHGSWHLYGHVHGKLTQGLISMSPMLDVGVDNLAMKPISFEELTDYFGKLAIKRQEVLKNDRDNNIGVGVSGRDHSLVPPLRTFSEGIRRCKDEEEYSDTPASKTDCRQPSVDSQEDIIRGTFE